MQMLLAFAGVRRALSSGVRSRRFSCAPAADRRSRSHPLEEEGALFTASTHRLLTASTWALTAGLGVYLVGVHDWNEAAAGSAESNAKPHVFSDVKPALRRTINRLFESG